MEVTVVVLFTITFVVASSSSKDIDDFHRLSSAFTDVTNTKMKYTEENRSKKNIEVKTEGSEESAFKSHVIHQGNNLFYQPQILIGSRINAPFLSHKIEDNNERKNEFELHTNKVTTNHSKPPIEHITEAPVSPLVIPDVPKVDIVEEVVDNTPHEELVHVDEFIEENGPVEIPEPPAYIPLNPPKAPIEVIIPQPIPHTPTSLNISYEISVPCPPIVAVPTQIIGVEQLTVGANLLVPKPTPIITLPLPKIPLGVVYNKPVKTVMPYLDGFISTTRFLPSVKVSKIPLDKFYVDKLLTHGNSGLVIEKTYREGVEAIEEEEVFSSFSAFCAHNIVLDRVLPNIIVSKDIVRVEPKLHIKDIPVRSVF